MSSNTNKENKMKEIMQKEMSSKIFSSIIVASTISAVSAVVAVKIKERINESIEECKVNNNKIICNFIMNPYLEILYFFILTFVSAVIFGIFFYYIFDKK